MHGWLGGWHGARFVVVPYSEALISTCVYACEALLPLPLTLTLTLTRRAWRARTCYYHGTTTTTTTTITTTTITTTTTTISGEPGEHGPRAHPAPALQLRRWRPTQPAPLRLHRAGAPRHASRSSVRSAKVRSASEIARCICIVCIAQCGPSAPSPTPSPTLSYRAARTRGPGRLASATSLTHSSLTPYSPLTHSLLAAYSPLTNPLPLLYPRTEQRGEGYLGA